MLHVFRYIYICPYTRPPGYTIPTFTLVVGVLDEACIAYTALRSGTKSLCVTVSWASQAVSSIRRVGVGLTSWNAMLRLTSPYQGWF